MTVYKPLYSGYRRGVYIKYVMDRSSKLSFILHFSHYHYPLPITPIINRRGRHRPSSVPFILNVTPNQARYANSVLE